jgi:hypothetical protein
MKSEINFYLLVALFDFEVIFITIFLNLICMTPNRLSKNYKSIHHTYKNGNFIVFVALLNEKGRLLLILLIEIYLSKVMLQIKTRIFHGFALI